VAHRDGAAVDVDDHGADVEVAHGMDGDRANTLLISNRSTLAGTVTQGTALSHDHAAEK
jgi:hypothetical protein